MQASEEVSHSPSLLEDLIPVLFLIFLCVPACICWLWFWEDRDNNSCCLCDNEVISPVAPATQNHTLCHLRDGTRGHFLCFVSGKNVFLVVQKLGHSAECWCLNAFVFQSGFVDGLYNVETLVLNLPALRPNMHYGGWHILWDVEPCPLAAQKKMTSIVLFPKVRFLRLINSVLLQL